MLDTMLRAEIKPMWAGAALVAVFVAVALAAIWASQRRLMYFPDPNVPAPASLGLSPVEAVTIPVAGAGALHGWFLPGLVRPSFTVIVFNGNAGNRAYRAPLGAALRRRGANVLLFDYRGFGGNAGVPTQNGLEADARAARAYLAKRRDVDPARLVYFGESLGTAVAIALAVEQAPAALILRSPFTSMVEVGQLHYPILPVRWLLRDRFLSIDAIAKLRSPVLVIAGDRDSIVPLELSRRLYDRATGPKQLIVLQGADHNDAVLSHGEQLIESVFAFLERAARGSW
jgi:fermentation-respiration switch protein FrsA (DUF1100 family)